MIVDRYYYHQLNKREQAIYRAFYDGVIAHQDIIPIPVKDAFPEDVFERIFDAITKDNPLIYYLNQSTCSCARDRFGHFAICPQYFLPKEKVREYNRKIEKEVNQLAGKLKLTEGTEYEKEVKIHDWICQNISYDEEGADTSKPIRVITSHSIIGVFAHHKAQCEGIAKAVKVLLNAVDVKCIVVTGKAVQSGKNVSHAWNIVDIGGNPYQLDVTWDIGDAESGKHRTEYAYFNLTDSLMQKEHKADGKLPECSAEAANYYVRRGCSFRVRHRLVAYIEKQMDQNETVFEFRAEDRLNKPEMEEEIREHILHQLAIRGNRSADIRIYSNRAVGVYRIEITDCINCGIIEAK